MDKRPVGRTKHAVLCLDDLAELQPGMSEYMIAMAHRYHVMYYAVRQGNYEMGRLQVAAIRKICRHAMKTRPKYKEALERFVREYLAPIENSIVARSVERFEKAVEASILASDEFHADWGYSYIRYRIPNMPPPGYLMTPPRVPPDGDGDRRHDA